MLVRRGSSYVGVVAALSFDARPFPRKETCLLEGPVPCNDSRARALTLGISRRFVTRRLDSLSVLCHALAGMMGKAVKGMIGRVLVSYHASRDCRVR